MIELNNIYCSGQVQKGTSGMQRHTDFFSGDKFIISLPVLYSNSYITKIIFVCNYI